MNKIFFKTFLFVSFCMQQVFAQEDYRPVMFQEALYLFNPAFAGAKHDFAFTLSHRREEVHTYNQRQTYFLGIDQNLPDYNLALGLSGYYHTANSYLPQNRWAVGGHLAFKFHLKNGATASVGSKVSLTNIKLDYTKIPIPNSPVNGTTYGALRTLPFFKTDMDFGVGYIQENFIAGVTLRHVNNPKWEIGGGYPSFFMNRELNFMSSYTLSIFDDQFQIRPSVWIHTRQNLFEVMPTFALGYKNAVFLGCSYYVFDRARNNSFPYDFGLQASFSIQEKFKLGIQYEHLRKVLYQGNFNYPATLYPVSTSEKRFANFEIHLSYQIPQSNDEDESTPEEL